jgi:N-methylhydantoinase B/oxoprolinase/acetone carboxylase alpha subunit
MNTPVEVMETAFPVRIRRYEINQIPAGQSLSRGLRRHKGLAAVA